MDKLLISLSHLQQYRPTADLDAATIEPFIREAQDMEFRTVVGPELYQDILTAIDDENHINYARYQTLVYGDNFIFRGAVPMLCYSALARLIGSGELKITRYGTRKKSATNSEIPLTEEIQAEIKRLNSVAATYRNEFVAYVDKYKTTYPLKDTSADINRQPGFKFFSL